MCYHNSAHEKVKEGKHILKWYLRNFNIYYLILKLIKLRMEVFSLHDKE